MLLYAETVDSVSRFLTVLILFVFVLFVTYFATRYIANFQKNKFAGSNIKIIETIRLTQNKYLQIVQVGKKYYSIAVCKDTVTVLGELTEDDITLPDPNKELPGFKDVLEKAKGKFKKKDDLK